MMQPSLNHPFAPQTAAPAPRASATAAAESAQVESARTSLAEMETAQRAAEITILWGDEVLHVAHVSPPRDFVVGEAGASATPDFAIGRELLGAERMRIVAERDGELFCVFPEGCRAEVDLGADRLSLDALEARGSLRSDDVLAGARLFALPEGASARIEHRGLVFLVRSTHAARSVAGPAMQLRHTGWIGVSLAVHAVFLVMFYFMPEHSAALSNDNLTRDTRLAQFLLAAAARDDEPPPELVSAGPSQSGEPGARHAGDEGQAGDPSARPSRGRLAVRGERENPRPELAREQMRQNMQSIGAIGTVRALVGSWNAPTSPYGADQSSGLDPESAVGQLFGDYAGANFGINGLGMRGTGRGGGGTDVDGIGVGDLGTIGTCQGANCGHGPTQYGSRVGSLSSDRGSRVPPVVAGRAQVNGGLAPEAIRRVVHRHLPEVRFCYEQGLQRNPSIEGRVTVRWIIGPDGRVQSSGLASSSVSSAQVESCIVSAVQRWTFPSPEGGGPVGVNYPFMLQSSQ
jgi:TonB family protein